MEYSIKKVLEVKVGKTLKNHVINSFPSCAKQDDDGGSVILDVDDENKEKNELGLGYLIDTAREKGCQYIWMI